MQIDIKTNKAFRFFWCKKRKEETAEISTEHDETEPENDQSREPKSNLFKCNPQQSWLEKYK